MNLNPLCPVICMVMICLHPYFARLLVHPWSMWQWFLYVMARQNIHPDHGIVRKQSYPCRWITPLLFFAALIDSNRTQPLDYCWERVSTLNGRIELTQIKGEPRCLSKRDPENLITAFLPFSNLIWALPSYTETRKGGKKKKIGVHSFLRKISLTKPLTIIIPFKCFFFSFFFNYKYYKCNRNSWSHVSDYWYTLAQIDRNRFWAISH